MNKQLLVAYTRHRQNGGRWVGHNAKQALKAAKTELLFDRLQDLELVRFEVRPDDDADLSWLDQTDAEMGRGFERLAKHERSRAHALDGCWGIVGLYRMHPSDDWIQADSCWGFIGRDWLGSGYDIDIKAECVKQLGNSLKARCVVCRK